MIRKAHAGDEAGIARVHVETWRAAYAGIVPASFLAKISEEKRKLSWQQQLSDGRSVIYVSVEGNEIAGFASGGGCRDPDTKDGAEIYAIYVSPKWWGTGIAQSLMEAVETELPQSSKITLWVLRDNPRAIRFYEKMGFRFDGTEKKHGFDGVFLSEVRMVKQKPDHSDGSENQRRRSAREFGRGCA